MPAKNDAVQKKMPSKKDAGQKRSQPFLADFSFGQPKKIPTKKDFGQKRCQPKKMSPKLMLKK